MSSFSETNRDCVFPGKLGMVKGVLVLMLLVWIQKENNVVPFMHFISSGFLPVLDFSEINILTSMYFVPRNIFCVLKSLWTIC